MPATIKDISRQTGISLATISKYLNGGNVLPENREKIDRAIKELDYHVNDIARSLVTRKSKVIGMTVPSLVSLFNGTLIQYVEEAITAEGYGLIICDSMEDAEREKSNVQFLLQKKVDGIIGVPTTLDNDAFKPAADSSVPVVLIDRKLNDFDTVLIDNREAGRMATQELIRAGHEKIGIIYTNAYTGAERYAGYREALEEAGIPLRTEYTKLVKTSTISDDSYEAMKSILMMEDRPTAMFMTTYDVNIGALLALRAMGVDYPDDISLIGFDDLGLPAVLRPSICVCVQPLQEMGRRASEQIMKKLRGEEEDGTAHIILHAELKEGESVRPVVH